MDCSVDGARSALRTPRLGTELMRRSVRNCVEDRRESEPPSELARDGLRVWSKLSRLLPDRDCPSQLPAVLARVSPTPSSGRVVAKVMALSLRRMVLKLRSGR
mmetsp:Transcript_6225/g.14247  ORF Transcript_6225/g.14247 Transcript_6225/m.14247 type:complete len:103 (+) Transcript_6225:184-492(+)